MIEHPPEWAIVDGTCEGCGSHVTEGIDEHMAAHRRGWVKARRALAEGGLTAPGAVGVGVTRNKTVTDCYG
jgi:hypothetical protein